MAQLYVGTSGWAYPSWKPDFYPEKLAQKKFLGFYATQLNTVEVNYERYREKLAPASGALPIAGIAPNAKTSPPPSA